MAREAAAKAGVSDRVKFEVAKAKEYPGKGYDFVAFFDCLHDMGDPEGAARHVHATLGTERDMDDRRAVRPRQARGQPESDRASFLRRFHDALHPCVAFAGSRLGLGAQAGEGRLSKILRSAGFTRVRRAAETPFNIVLEARP